MSGLLEWLDMGGYGVYVWPSYGLALALLGGLALQAWRRERRLLEKLRRKRRARP